MKGQSHHPEQIIRKLRTAEQLLNQGQTIVDVCRALEVLAPTYQRWQQQYGGMKATEVKLLKELELENAAMRPEIKSEMREKVLLGFNCNE